MTHPNLKPVEPVPNVAARYEGYRALQHLVAAQEALDTAGTELIAAKLGLPLTETTDAARFDIERMISTLYADKVTIGDNGGNAQAWDIRSVIMRMGEAICAIPEEGAE